MTQRLERTPEQLTDKDKDGWCDQWCSLYPSITHGSKTVDTDDDGSTDYQEMLVWRNPLLATPPPRVISEKILQLSIRQLYSRHALYMLNKSRE